MARMDAISMKMDARYKDFQYRSKQSNLDDDDIPMSCEEEAKLMQTFRRTRFYNDYRDRASNHDNCDDEDDEPTPQPKPKTTTPVKETLKPTPFSCNALADLAENMLVEVGKFTFPVNFVILEMEEDIRTERMIFHIDTAMKHSYSNDDTCFTIDVIDEILEEDEGSEILHSIEGIILEEKLFAKFDEFMTMTANENSESESDTEEPPFKKITFNTGYKIKTSLEEPPIDLELKPLPNNLEYVFLEEPSFLPVIISSQLSKQNKN
ncbi:hypothetical protein Tco_1495130, partial [Tanacetum coccineum]